MTLPILQILGTGGSELLILVVVVVIGLFLLGGASTRSGGVKLLIVLGIGLFILDSFFTSILDTFPRNQALYDFLTALQPITGLWWIAVLAGIGLAVYPRLKDAEALSISGRQGGVRIRLDRQDIIEATDWTRIGRFMYRRSIGIALAVSTIILLIVSLVLQKFTLAALWLLLLILGVVMIAASWRRAHPTVQDFTQTISVRAPDQFAVHSFHVALRQQAEDLGYQITSNASPTESGNPSAANQDVFHARGGFTGQHRLIGESKSLVSDVESGWINRILTRMTLGLFIGLSGILLMAVDPDELILVVLGLIFLIVGAIIVIYDYLMRSREWAELYCIEEGTIYKTTFNKYEDDVLDSFDSRVDPTVATSETASILSVTISGKCSPLYDEESLEEDFATLVESIETAAEDYRFDVLNNDETTIGTDGSDMVE